MPRRLFSISNLIRSCNKYRRSLHRLLRNVSRILFSCKHVPETYMFTRKMELKYYCIVYCIMQANWWNWNKSINKNLIYFNYYKSNYFYFFLYKQSNIDTNKTRISITIKRDRSINGDSDLLNTRLKCLVVYKFLKF